MQVNTTGPIARVRVTGDGSNVTGQAGTHLLGRIAGRFGVTGGLSALVLNVVIPGGGVGTGPTEYTDGLDPDSPTSTGPEGSSCSV